MTLVNILRTNRGGAGFVPALSPNCAQPLTPPDLAPRTSQGRVEWKRPREAPRPAPSTAITAVVIDFPHREGNYEAKRKAQSKWKSHNGSAEANHVH